MNDAPITLDQLPPIATQRGGDPELLFTELKDVIADAILNHPRTLQTRIGPSEIGDPCARRIAYKLTHTPPARTMPPGWRPTVGTAVHTWLEEAVATWNQTHHERNGASRYLLEHRVRAGWCAGDWLDGSTDLYDRATATAVDWKIVGPSSLKRLSSDLRAGRGPRPEYRVQLHTYGLGWANRGMPVDHVMLIALPAAGELDDALMWSQPYDPDIARTAMARVDRIHTLTDTLNAAAWTVTNGQLAAAGAGHLADPHGEPSAPAISTDTYGCRFCPWLKGGSTDLTTGCPGAGASADDGASNLRALIA